MEKSDYSSEVDKHDSLVVRAMFLNLGTVLGIALYRIPSRDRPRR